MIKKRLLRSISGVLLAILLLLVPTAKVLAKVIITESGSSFFEEPFTQSSGNVGVMVIPVEFEDELLPENATDQLKEIFWGEGVNGVPSVMDYYEAASYGDIYMDIVVQRVVTLPGNRDDYADASLLIDACMEVISEVREVPVASFDENGDEYLDALYIVFAGDGADQNSFWWPHTENFYSEEMWEYDAYVGGCSFLSYDMLISDTKIHGYSAIHETGHLMGLTDYYQSSSVSGTSADTMMDLSSGDIDCFSKLMLGWCVPQTVTGTGTYYLTSETLSGDALILTTPEWDGNYLSEYFMVEYVTPDENQAELGIPEGGAIRVWHVNAGTSAFTNDVTPDMFKADNKSAEKVLSMAAPARQWYGLNEVVPTAALTLYDGTSLGAEIKMIQADGEEATVMVTYGIIAGESLEETSEPKIEDDPAAEEETKETSAEETSGEEEFPLPPEEESAEDQKPQEDTDEDPKNEETRIFSVSVDHTEIDNQVKGDVKARKLTVPMAVSIILAFFGCFLLIRAAKKDNKKSKKRYIRRR